MSFVREYETILKKSDGSIYSINYSNGSFSVYDDEKNICNEKITNEDLSFVDVWFDIDNKDNIYGIINNKEGKILYFNELNNIKSKVSFYNYDKYKTLIKFPYIKNINDESHIIYYSMDAYDGNFFRLIHYNKVGDKIVKQEIDKIECIILSNFCVEFTKDMMYVFYFKIVDQLEEIFVSCYDLKSKVWGNPIQLTSTNKQKVYLSLAKDNENNFFVTYSENNDSKYYCMCLKVNIFEGKIVNKNIKVVNECVECTFPQVIRERDSLYIQWVEYGKLIECFSKDSGESFSKGIIYSKSIDSDFIRCNYGSNNLEDKDLSLTTVFLEY